VFEQSTLREPSWTTVLAASMSRSSPGNYEGSGKNGDEETDAQSHPLEACTRVGRSDVNQGGQSKVKLMAAMLSPSLYCLQLWNRLGAHRLVNRVRRERANDGDWP
jgi:hypothetical protein